MVEEKIPSEAEWRWCIVGNINKETKHFRPNAKVYINPVYGGMGHERILAIGLPRRSHRYIEIVIARNYVENLRLQKVYKPAVLECMKKSDWSWWENTDADRDRILDFLE